MSRPPSASTPANATANKTEDDKDAGIKETVERMDGGLTALGGFYLQFVGTLSGIISDFWVERHQTADDAPYSERETIFGIEVGDQDAFSLRVSGTGHKILTLVQFKFSLTSKLLPVQPHEMTEILKKMSEFAAGHTLQSQDGNELRFIMATNRPRSPLMETLWLAAKKDGSHPRFLANPRLKGWLQGCEWKEVTRQNCHEQIVNWAREFGLSPSEIEQGVRNIVAEFVERVEQGRRIFGQSEVEKMFASSHTARRLNSPETQKDIQDGIDDFVDWLSVPLSTDENLIDSGKPESGLPKLLARKNLRRSLSDAVQQHALILLVGDGGNGKSTLLSDLLKTWPRERFTTGLSVSELSVDWLSERISTWRGNADSRTEDWGNALNRLTRYRADSPILLLALDALDESNATKSKSNEVFKLLRFFAREERAPHPPRATLIVTCRRKSDLNEFFREPGMQSSNPKVSPYHAVEVLSFTPTELLSLVREKRENVSSALNVYERIEKTLAARETLAAPYQQFPAFGLNPVDVDPSRALEGVDLARGDAVEALCHPIVWGRFCQHLSPSEQHAALDGDEGSWDKVAFQLLDWFSEKCVRRCPIRVTREEVKEIVLAVATSHGEPDIWYRSNEWRQAARLVAAPTAPIEVLRQAISSGLVAEKNMEEVLDYLWRWRHPFWVKFLERGAAQRNT